MIKILDRYIIRSFLYTALLCFFVLMALRIVVDLFVNMDEFVKGDNPFGEILLGILTYYGTNSLVYFTELGGIIIVASAAFTLAYMNHTNELTAMLASGVSLHRVVWPIVLCAMLLGGLIILDRELVIPIPEIREKLVRDRDNPFQASDFQVRLVTDGSKTTWYSCRFSPANERIDLPVLILRDNDLKAVATVTGGEGRPVGKAKFGLAGWVFEDATLSWFGEGRNVWEALPSSEAVYTSVSPAAILQASGQGPAGTIAVRNPRMLDGAYGLEVRAARFEPSPAGGAERGGTLIDPVFIFRRSDGEILVVFFGSSAQWDRHSRGAGFWRLADGRLFYPSDLSSKELQLRQSSSWLDYMSSADLGRLLALDRVPDRTMAVMSRHVRVTEPINNLVMLLLALPFILSRERNLKASATLCLLMVGTYYTFIYLCRYIGLPPTWAAWLPILLFGPVAAVMLDSVKT